MRVKDIIHSSGGMKLSMMIPKKRWYGSYFMPVLTLLFILAEIGPWLSTEFRRLWEHYQREIFSPKQIVYS